MENEENYKNTKINISNEEYIVLSPTKEDIPEIKALGYYFWEDDGIFSEDFYEQIICQDLSLLYKHKEEDIIIAMCLNLYEKETNEVDIAVLCVETEFQRQGLGESILKLSIDKCVKKGYHNFYLHVAVGNEGAIRLYKKVGFILCETVKNYYYDDPPPNNDAFLMRLIKNKKEEKKEFSINYNKNKNDSEFSMVECKIDNNSQKFYNNKNKDNNLCNFICVVVIIIIVVFIICLAICSN